MTVVDVMIEERDQKVIVTILILTKLNKSHSLSVCICSGRVQKISLQKWKTSESQK